MQIRLHTDIIVTPHPEHYTIINYSSANSKTGRFTQENSPFFILLIIICYGNSFSKALTAASSCWSFPLLTTLYSFITLISGSVW